MRPLLSRRKAAQGIDGPYSGVPDHLKGPLLDWLQSGAWDDYRGWSRPLLAMMALELRVAVPAQADPVDLWRLLSQRAAASDEFTLDWIDLYLTWQQSPTRLETLEGILRLGGSVFTVNVAEQTLELLVSDEMRAMTDSALAPVDTISEELRRAWAHAYGRRPDPSDAWDHAIKAVEECLVPLVCPNNAKATLAHVLGELRVANNPWKLGLLDGKDQSRNPQRLVGMLELLWPNPDRHGGGPTRRPNLAEAQAVVALAVLIVQWHRSGCLLGS